MVAACVCEEEEEEEFGARRSTFSPARRTLPRLQTTPTLSELEVELPSSCSSNSFAGAMSAKSLFSHSTYTQGKRPHRLPSVR